MSEAAVRVRNVTKRFGQLTALDRVSLEIARGEIFGIIGHNGAGKSTLMHAVAGLVDPDEGSIDVLGLDPQNSGRKLRERVGIQLQDAQLQDQMRVHEALELYASFYETSVDTDALLDEWGLTGKRSAKFRELSGGQKQRTLICLALVSKPELVILDELTTGLDPRARRDSWDLVRRIRDLGTTVILVTHFMEEAQHLCDRIALVERGRIMSLGTPAELVGSETDARRVTFTLPEHIDLRPIANLAEVEGVERLGHTVVASGSGFVMAAIAATLRDLNINPHDLRTESRTLEDVFLAGDRQLAGTATEKG